MVTTATAPSPAQPDEALAWHRARVPLSAAQAAALDQSAKRRAFYLAGVTQVALVSDVQQEIARALEQGTTLEEFKATVGARLEAAWGGSIKNPASRLETIFRTNVQAAYNAGRHAQATDPETLKLRPFWQFDAVLDDRTTPVCKSCNAVVAPAGDSWWQRHLPPLHFNCRSTFHPLTARQAERLGVTTELPADEAAPGFGAPPSPAEAPPPPTPAHPVAEVHGPTGLPMPPPTLVPVRGWREDGTRDKVTGPDRSKLPRTPLPPGFPTKSGVYQLPLEQLAALPSDPWNLGRYAAVRSAYARAEALGVPVDQVAQLPPIEVQVYPNGQLELNDGNHRLTVAREFGAPSLPVRLTFPRGFKPLAL